MVCRMPGNVKITVKAGFYLYCALLMLVLPLRWVCAALMAATIHELWHIAAIKLCRVELLQVEIGALGAKLHTGPMTYKQELICALAGPVGALTMLLASRWLSATSFCCAVHSVCNLLPLYPADGGRAVRCLLLLFISENRAEIYINILECILRVGIGLLGFYGTFVLHLGTVPFLVALGVCFGKFPCKADDYRVQ